MGEGRAYGQVISMRPSLKTFSVVRVSTLIDLVIDYDFDLIFDPDLYIDPNLNINLYGDILQV